MGFSCFIWAFFSCYFLAVPSELDYFFDVLFAILLPQVSVTISSQDRWRYRYN